MAEKPYSIRDLSDDKWIKYQETASHLSNKELAEILEDCESYDWEAPCALAGLREIVKRLKQ